MLSLTQPTEASAPSILTPNPLLVDMNLFPEETSTPSNSSFMDLLFPNPIGMPSMTYNNFHATLLNTPLPEIESPQIPPPLLLQSDTQPHDPEQDLVGFQTLK